MGGKKIKKHTAGAINKKIAATKAKNGAAGHGKKGMVARTTRAAKFVCKEIGCGANLPNANHLEMHYENKHKNKSWAAVKAGYDL